MKTFYTIAVIFLLSFNSFASELYIRINRSGNHQVSISGQSQTNSTNFFRFYDLGTGNTLVTIIDLNTNTTVFSSTVNLIQNQRTVAELNQNGSMTVIMNLPVVSSSWYESNTQNGSGTVINNGNQGAVIYGSGVDAVSFQKFLELLDDESFDSGKQKKVEAYAKKANLSAAQIAEICSKFTFDSYRLEAAKAGYTTCTDKMNYFMLKEKFTFNSYYTQLEEWIEKQ